MQSMKLSPSSRSPAQAIRRGLASVCAGAMLVCAAGFGFVPPTSGMAPDELTPPSLIVGLAGDTVRLEGDLADGTAERLSHLLAAHPGVRVLSLSSDGGLVDEAREIGRLARERRLTTYVPDSCVSACTLAFVYGSERLAAPGAKLGFHAPYVTDEAGAASQLDGAEERAAYEDAGIDGEFAAEAIRVASTEIWYPDAARLLAARVVTRFLGPAESGPGSRPSRVAGVR